MKTWPVIRHLRYIWLAWRLSRYMDTCRQLGLGITPNPNDLRYLEDVLRGKC